MILQWLLFFLLVLLCFVFSCPLSVFLSDYSMMSVLSVSLFTICFLCVWFLKLGVTGA